MSHDDLAQDRIDRELERRMHSADMATRHPEWRNLPVNDTRALPYGFTRTPNGGLRTPADVIIGGAYERRRNLELDAVLAHAAQLPPPKPTLRQQLVDCLYSLPWPLFWTIVLIGATSGIVQLVVRR